MYDYCRTRAPGHVRERELPHVSVSTRGEQAPIHAPARAGPWGSLVRAREWGADSVTRVTRDRMHVVGSPAVTYSRQLSLYLMKHNRFVVLEFHYLHVNACNKKWQYKIVKCNKSAKISEDLIS